MIEQHVFIDAEDSMRYSVFVKENQRCLADEAERLGQVKIAINQF